MRVTVEDPISFLVITVEGQGSSKRNMVQRPTDMSVKSVPSLDTGFRTVPTKGRMQEETPHSDTL